MSQGENVRALEAGKVLTWHSNTCDDTALISCTEAIPKLKRLSENSHVRISEKGPEELGILTRGSSFERLYETLREVAVSEVTVISALEPVGTYQCVY